MNWSIDTIHMQGSAVPWFVWLVGGFLALALAWRGLRYIIGNRTTEISGKIDRICQQNIVQIDVGERACVNSGYVFTVYKRLCMSRINPASGERTVSSVDYRPVAQAKVISTTRHHALCKYRPIQGFSSAPCVGDTVLYSNSKASKKVAPQPS